MLLIKSSPFINIILFVIFIFSFNYIETTSEFDSLPGKRFTTSDEIQNFLKKIDLTILVFYYRTNSEISKEVAKNLKIVYSKLKYLTDFILINCDDNDMAECRLNNKNLDEDNFFYLEIYIPPELKFNPYTKEINKHHKIPYSKTNISEKALYNFISKGIISKEQMLTLENFENFKSRSDLNKVILFTNKKNSPLMYRGLSGYFYDRLSFGIVFDNDKKLCEKLNINKFPTIMIIQIFEDDIILDEPNEIIYEGGEDVESIVNFLEKYAFKEKLYLSKDDKKKKRSSNDLIYFNKLTAEKAFNFIKNKKDKEVILYFDNNVLNGKITYDNLSEDIKEFNVDTHGFFHFGYVDCTGEEKEKICKNNFKIKDFPNFVLYRPEKDVKEKIAKGYELPMEMSNIRREIELLYEPKVNTVTPVNFQYTLSTLKSNRDGYINLGFNLITQQKIYSEFIDYFVMDNPPEEIKQQFQCTYYPYMTIIIPDDSKKDENGNPQMQVMVYRGKFSFSEINSFLKSNFHIDDKESKEQSFSESDNTPVEIDFIQSTKDLEKTCSKKKLCIIITKKISKKNSKYLKTFQKYQKKDLLHLVI